MNNAAAVKLRRKKGPYPWSDHHFIGGNLALDLANTVVYRTDAVRCEDRLLNRASLLQWCHAAGVPFHPSHRTSLGPVLALRETIDRFFRRAALSNRLDPDSWRDLIELHGRYASRLHMSKSSDGLQPASIQAARHPTLLGLLVHSAVALTLSPGFVKVKVCPACGWLFLDRTRSGNKRWCITALCGNRNKSRRYYARRLRKALS
jgi:predicted RNA-binding Zn ribbon-like protein